MGRAEWILSMKQSFLSEWLACPPREARQIQEKIDLLLKDPRPDAKVKKQLKYLSKDKQTKLYRIRCGVYRLFYTFKDPYVSLLAIRRREEDTYDEDLDPQLLGGLSAETGGSVGGQEKPRWSPTPPADESPRTPLPGKITTDLLRSLRISDEHDSALLDIEDEETLFACPWLDDGQLLRLHEALIERPIEEVLNQKEFVAASTADLIRFKEGDLLGFLLKLDPEQERFVSWTAGATGPTLVKGAPGTGKTTVALHRVASVVEVLRRGGTAHPRILFTTYTNALVAFSRQLLEGLLDDDTALLEVRTADSLVREIVTAVDGEPRIVGPTELRELLNLAVAEASLGGNPLQARSMRQTLRRLGTEYLDSEIHSVIVARGLARIEDYLAAARPGRRVPLTALQRQAVWAVKEALATLLSEKGLLTWQGLRSRAAALVSERSIDEPYDAVVIDEAQDLDPTVLRVLVAACRSPERLFLTADANQSIYGNGFRWSDVHDVLRFRGRTGVLRTNHRSTEEIGSATQSYLAEGRLDEDEPEPAYEHSGPIPVVRFVKSEKAEADLLVQFLREAARECRLAPWVGAVLVPSEEAGRRIVTMLQAAEVDAAFMASRDLDLAARCVKVLTLRACKGLEFPVVALAGFVSQPWPLFRDDMPREQRTERLVQARRTLFVAMTRAMRALMVVGSAGYQSSLFAGFEPARWNTQ